MDQWAVVFPLLASIDGFSLYLIVGRSELGSGHASCCCPEAKQTLGFQTKLALKRQD